MTSQVGRVSAVTRSEGQLTEEVAFFGPQGGKLFGCLHLPAHPASAGAVVCSPVASEFEKNYRRETLLAWSLAGRGVPVLRFHYRGQGHSDGNAAHLSFETMLQDAGRAVEHLRSVTGVHRVGFVGSRVGGLVAAAAARDSGDAPVALWEPVLDGEDYFREVFRVAAMGELKEGTARPLERDRQLRGLRREGWVDVLGFTIGLPLWESVKDRTLLGEMGGAPRPVLVVQFSAGKSVRAPYRRLADDLVGAGFAVEVRVLTEMESWWLGDYRRGKAALTRATTEWMERRLGGERPDSH